MDGGRSIDAAGDVFGEDCTISQVRAAAIRRSLCGSLWRSHGESFPCRKPQRVLKIFEKSEQN
jgi:hypothetical protein